MKRILIVVTALGIISGLLAGCGGGNANPAGNNKPGTKIETACGTYWEITPEELYSMISGEIFILQYDSVKTGNIPATDLYIEYPYIEENIDKFPADKSTYIVIYCTQGSKSAEGASYLVSQGYSSVFQLAGGSIAWRNQGYPIIAG